MIFFVTLGVLVVGTLLLYLSLRGAVRKAFKSKPRTPLDATTPGQGQKIVATVQDPAKPLIAPLSKRPCAYYRLEIAETASRVRRTLLTESVGDAFEVRDDKGTAVVKPTKETIFQLLSDLTNGVSGKASPAVTALLAERGIELGTKLGTQIPLEYRETAVLVGAKLAILGLIEHEQGRVKLERVVISDDPTLM